MIIQKTVKIKWARVTKSYYMACGYKYTKLGDEFEIQLKDLMKESNMEITFKCDFCGKISTKRYNRLYGKAYQCCNDKYCIQQQKERTMMERYGVKHILQSDEYLEKAKATCKKHLGVDYPGQSKQVQEKMKQTCLQKYGVEYSTQAEIMKEHTNNTMLEKYGVKSPRQDEAINQKAQDTCQKKYGAKCPAQNENVMNKMKKTMLKKYGFTTATKNEKVKEKTRQTNLKKYGVECVMYCEEFKKKARENFVKKYNINTVFELEEVQKKAKMTLYKNGKIPCSKSQRHICDLINAQLNYPVYNFFLDMALVKEKIDIEYDGTGHNLNVQCKGITQAEFNNKELIRNKKLMNDGWKIIRIINNNIHNRDRLFADEQMIYLINICKDYLLNTKHRWININIDDLKIESTEYNVKLDKNGNIIINKK